MKVNIKSIIKVGNKAYNPGVQDVPDNLYANRYFKELVQKGVVVYLPKDDAAQKAQASKDARVALKAQTAADDSAAKVAESAGNGNPTLKFPKEPPTLKSVEEAQAKLPAQESAAAVAPPAASADTPTDAAQASPPASSAKSKQPAKSGEKSGD